MDVGHLGNGASAPESRTVGDEQGAHAGQGRVPAMIAPVELTGEFAQGRAGFHIPMLVGDEDDAVPVADLAHCPQVRSTSL